MNDRENRVGKRGEVPFTIPGTNKKKLLGLLGFAARARKLTVGTDLCRDDIRRGKLYFTMVASDASENTKKRIADACRYYDAMLCYVPLTADELSHIIGKSANIAVVGVTDINFINGITALAADNNE